MGRFKELMIEEEERSLRTGLSYHFEKGEKFASADLSDDIYVQEYITTNGFTGTCSYTGIKTKVIDIVELSEWVVEKIRKYFRNPDDDNLYIESTFFDKDEENEEDSPIIKIDGYVTSRNALHFDETEKLLYYFDFSNNSQLIEDIANNIYNTRWINIDSCSPRKDQELNYYWDYFAKKVKETKVYLPSSVIEIKAMLDGTGEQPYDMILDDIAYILIENNCFTTLTTGMKLFRCRNINDRSEIKDAFKDMTSAPKEYAYANRMSKAGDSMFYGAFSKEVCLREAVDHNKPLQVLAKFECIQNINLVDLTKLPSPSLWGKYDMWGSYFLHLFTQKISENFETYSKTERETSYIPSQVFTDYIRRMKHPVTDQQLNGLIYYSSKIKGQQNVVLFTILR